MSAFCKNCGSPLRPGVGFCDSCGAGTQDNGQVDAAGDAAMPRSRDLPGPLRYLKEKFRAGMDSARQLLKTPRRLVPMLVLGVLWLVLSLLSAWGINPQPVRLLSFLTFAQGGMYGGVWGAVGGVIGKAVFAYFVSALILPLFMGQNPFRGVGRGVKSLFAGLRVQSVDAAAQLTLGIGLALVVYNFLSGNASAVNSMAGVVGFVLALKALWTGGGFFWGLLLSVANPFSRGRIPSQVAIGRVISGYAAGSALGVALSALSRPYWPLTAYLPYITGVTVLIIGLVLVIVTKSKNEVASA